MPRAAVRKTSSGETWSPFRMMAAGTNSSIRFSQTCSVLSGNLSQRPARAPDCVMVQIVKEARRRIRERKLGSNRALDHVYGFGLNLRAAFRMTNQRQALRARAAKPEMLNSLDRFHQGWTGVCSSLRRGVHLEYLAFTQINQWGGARRIGALGKHLSDSLGGGSGVPGFRYCRFLVCAI